MRDLKAYLAFAWVILAISSCSKKAEPESTLNRGQEAATSEFSDPSRGPNPTDEEFSPAGTALDSNQIDFNDPLSPRDPSLEAFSDPLNVIRPFEPVFFGFDQYNIVADERAKLIEIAEFIMESPEARVLIEGYCDWKGTPAYNKALGERRANSVKQYLVELGADSQRIETVSIGDESAIPNADGQQAKLDRRASFVVTKLP